MVENLFQRMKVFRRVATRYDKLDVTFLGFVYIAGIMKCSIDFSKARPSRAAELA